MADVSEIMKLTPEELAEVKSSIRLFHILGMTDEEISLLPQIAKNWGIVVSNMNAMATDLADLRSRLSTSGGKREDGSLDTDENIRRSFGFGENAESVFLKEGFK